MNPATKKLINRLLANRNIKMNELYHDRDTLPSPFEMKDMDKACEIVSECIKNKRKIVVVADFDCDGATSCAVMVRGLIMLGHPAEMIDFVVPNRFVHGYGLTPALVDTIDSEPGLFITVDNGISSHAGVAAVRDRFPYAQVVVTDHHLQGDSLPEADAIVNPNRKDCTFPSKSIAGVGVAFYLLLALKSIMKSDAPINSLLDIVSLGTICDVVPLDRLNRTLVHHGLHRVRSGKAVPGINALIKVAAKETDKITTQDYGFAFGPRINAAGRLDTMMVGINLLIEEDPDAAYKLAVLLDETNIERKLIEKEMQEQATTLISGMDLTQAPKAFLLYDERWHQGVIGLVASRIKEKTYRPTMIFAKGDGNDIKASCRSIPGVHIRDILANVFVKHPEFGERFGGHAMAAGLTIDISHFNAFKAAVESEMEAVSPDVFEPTINTDGELKPEEITIETAEILTQTMPWGQGFQAPLFENSFKVDEVRSVGDDGKHLRLRVELPNGKKITGISFNQPQPEYVQVNETVKMIYSLDVNEWNGNRSAQLMIRGI